MGQRAERQEQMEEKRWLQRRSISRGEGEAMGWTRVRPSSFIVWSLCRSQHGWQMRWLIEMSMVESSCNVKMLSEGSG